MPAKINKTITYRLEVDGLWSFHSLRTKIAGEHIVVMRLSLAGDDGGHLTMNAFRKRAGLSLPNLIRWVEEELKDQKSYGPGTDMAGNMRLFSSDKATQLCEAMRKKCSVFRGMEENALTVCGMDPLTAILARKCVGFEIERREPRIMYVGGIERDDGYNSWMEGGTPTVVEDYVPGKEAYPTDFSVRRNLTSISMIKSDDLWFALAYKPGSYKPVQSSGFGLIC